MAGRRHGRVRGRSGRRGQLALKAVLEALDVPQPATMGDETAYIKVLEQRVMHARAFLRDILREDMPMDLDWEIDYLRGKLADHPATGYRHWPSGKDNATSAPGGVS